MSFSHSIPTLAPDEHDEPRLGPRVWAGAILIVASLGFFLLAGCFAIGILILLNPSSLNGKPPPSAPALSAEETTFLITLYVLAGLSVVAAAVLFFLGLTGLVRILFGKTAPA
jgi:hypothetical protein